MNERIKYTAVRNPNYLEDSPVLAISHAVYSKARSFIRDDSAMEDDGAYSGSAGILTKPIARELGSWFATSEARDKTLRNAIALAAVQLALM